MFGALRSIDLSNRDAIDIVKERLLWRVTNTKVEERRVIVEGKERKRRRYERRSELKKK